MIALAMLKDDSFHF